MLLTKEEVMMKWRNGKRWTILENFGTKCFPLIKRILCILIILCLVLLLLFFAWLHGNVSTKQDPVELIIDYDVPFLSTGSSRWMNCELIDKDDYGRLLYKYGVHYDHEFLWVFEDYILENDPEELDTEEVCAYIVCQKKSRDMVYYYESDCYLYTPTFETEQDDLNAFLIKNDWDQPLDLDKAIGVSRKYESWKPVHHQVYGEEATNAIDELERVIDRMVEEYFIDSIFTPELKPIYVVREVLKGDPMTSPFEFGDSFIFVLDEDGKMENVEELFGFPDNWNDQIKAFREDCE